MSHPLVRAVRAALEDAADPAKARPMQAYMKSAMPYRGVNAPEQRRIWRELFARHPLDSFQEWKRVALELWRDAEYREERYAVIALTDMRPYRTYRTFASLPMFEEMIVTGAWWDLVDGLATHQLGDILRADARRMKPVMRRWAKDPDMWKRRSAILCQNRFRTETDLDLLYACIEPSLDSGHSTRQKASSLMAGEFFIRKAIGWALRQYAWTDAKEVKRYVTQNRSRLSPLSVREAMKNIG